MPAAPSRYANAPLIGAGTRIYLGRRVLSNTLPRGDDRFVVVKVSDNLHRLAFRHLGDMRLWWVIADFNDIIDPMAELVPGTSLRVPSGARLYLDVLK